MNTPTKLDGAFIHHQPTFHFWHNDKEYIIYLWVSAGDDPADHQPFIFFLAEPVLEEGLYVPKEILRSQAWQLSGPKSEYDSVKEGIEKHFLPKVNEYLAAQTGGTLEFPITGSDLEQYNWIVKHGLEYVDGQVRLK